MMNLKEICYRGQILYKKQVILAYDTTARGLRTMLDALGIKTGKRKRLWPIEIRALISEYGEGDWSKIPELKKPQ